MCCVLTNSREQRDKFIDVETEKAFFTLLYKLPKWSHVDREQRVPYIHSRHIKAFC